MGGFRIASGLARWLDVLVQAEEASHHDAPKAARAPLRLVQEFVSTVDLEHEGNWIGAWLERQGVRPTARNRARAIEVREALREVMRVSNGHRRSREALAVLDKAARAARLTIDFSQQELRPEARGLEGVLGAVIAAWALLPTSRARGTPPTNSSYWGRRR